MATTRWKDKTLITALADDDNFPVTDTDDTNTDKRATAAKIGSYVASATLTLSGKTFDLGSNTMTGTAAEFDAALQSDTFVFNSEIGSVVQAWDADLDTLAGLSSADGNFIVGSATGWVVESGATVRTSLGLGSLATLSEVSFSDIADAAIVTEAEGISSNDNDTTIPTSAAVRDHSPIKAWVNFDGTGTVSIRESFNVSSITDIGTGKYDVNFQNSMVDSDYAVSISGRKNDSNDDANFTAAAGSTTRTPSSTSCPITTAFSSNASARDFPDVYVLVVR